MTCPPLRETQALEMVEQALAREDGEAALAALLDRLVQLVREQEAQIRALQAMVETGL